MDISLEPGSGLLPGMFARLEIPIGSRARLLVPEAALLRSGQLSFVRVRTADAVERRLVRTGRRHGEAIEVVSGLSPGERVLLPEAAAGTAVNR